MEVLVKGDDPAGVAPTQVVTAASKVDGVAAAFAPDNPQWRTDGAALVGGHPDRGDRRLDARRTSSTTSTPRSTASPGWSASPASGATVLDYINAVYKKFPYSLGLIALVTFILLVRDVPVDPAAGEGGRC